MGVIVSMSLRYRKKNVCFSGLRSDFACALSYGLTEQTRWWKQLSWARWQTCPWPLSARTSNSWTRWRCWWTTSVSLNCSTVYSSQRYRQWTLSTTQCCRTIFWQGGERHCSRLVSFAKLRIRNEGLLCPRREFEERGSTPKMPSVLHLESVVLYSAEDNTVLVLVAVANLYVSNRTKTVLSHLSTFITAGINL